MVDFLGYRRFMSDTPFDRRSALSAMGGSLALLPAAGCAESPRAPLGGGASWVQFEDFGAVGDGQTDDSSAILSALGSGERIVPNFATYAIGQEIALDHDGVCDLAGCVLKQAAGADLSSLVRVGISNRNSLLQSSSTVVVDGNRAQNVGDVTGVEVTKLKKALGQLVAAAQDCTTGIRITDQVEYAKIAAHAENCDLAVHLRTDSRTTPDELLLHVFAHDCGTFLRSEGTNKMSGTIFVSGEQCDNWGVELGGIGWWQVLGMMRGCGKQGGGGLRVDGPNVRGELQIVGGHRENCEWGADFVSGQSQGLALSLAGRFARGVRVQGAMQGSLKLFIQNAPAEGAALTLGGGGEPLDGFHIEDGSRLFGGQRGVAVDIADCRNSFIGAGVLVGTCAISEQAYGNTVVVPRSSALGRARFTNKRAQCDNRICLRGVYDLEELERVNRGQAFLGMEAEMCRDFGMQRARFDGAKWVRA
ncbi:MAG: hypothetical protein AAGA34_06675 [Pseudomonadota bacterium]